MKESMEKMMMKKIRTTSQRQRQNEREREKERGNGEVWTVGQVVPCE